MITEETNFPVFLLIAFVLFSSVEVANANAQSKPKSKIGYKTSEKIEKAPSEDHPCNLTKTSMKIAFPELKNELFVNILGYREPNLVRLWQCKGFCGERNSSIICAPLKVTQKVVVMTFRTNSSGRDSTEGSQELILDEHVECGCSCNDEVRKRCNRRFNPSTCTCECDQILNGEIRQKCEGQVGAYWDDEKKNEER